MSRIFTSMRLIIYMKMTLGEKLKQLRIENEMSQKDLAKELGIFFTAISKWEKDEYLPSIVYLNKMKKIFKVTLDEIVEDVKF